MAFSLRNEVQGSAVLVQSVRSLWEIAFEFATAGVPGMHLIPPRQGRPRREEGAGGEGGRRKKGERRREREKMEEGERGGRRKRQWRKGREGGGDGGHGEGRGGEDVEHAGRGWSIGRRGKEENES
eukprot:2045884-Rhodomonas_salina.2